MFFFQLRVSIAQDHSANRSPLRLCKFKKWKVCIALHGNPSQSYGASPAIWDHTVLPATRHRWTRPALTPAKQTGTQFTYPRGTEGWVGLGGWLYTEMVCPHPRSNHVSWQWPRRCPGIMPPPLSNCWTFPGLPYKNKQTLKH